MSSLVDIEDNQFTCKYTTIICGTDIRLCSFDKQVCLKVKDIDCEAYEELDYRDFLKLSKPTS